MKAKFLSLLLLNLAFVVSLQAQTEAVKIDDYAETTKENLELLAKKTKSFAERLKKEPESSRAFVIYYLNESTGSCKEKSKTKVEERVEFVKDQLTNKYKISSDRIVVSADRFRNDTRVEFWIAPQGVREPTGEGGFISDCFCSDLRISTNLGMPFGENEIVSFTAKIEGVFYESIKWSVSEGEITDGQGTSAIKVNVSK